MKIIARKAWNLLFSLVVRVPLPNALWSLITSFPFWLMSRTLVRWDVGNKLFLVHSGQQHLFVARRSRINWYVKGVHKRLERLGAEYGLESVPLQRGDLAIDIGANIGEFSLLLESAGLNVVAFEPDPSEFLALERNIGVRSAAHAIALWNENGTAEFFQANDHGDSSLIRPITAERISTKVRTMKLDTFMEGSDYMKRKIKIIKLEAEGAEPEILEGAAKTLERVEWILADVGFERGVKAESTLPAVVHTLVHKGFQLVSVRPGRLVAIFKNLNLVSD